MPYYRRPYKRARYGKRIKYSVQQKALDFVLSGTTTSKVEIVPATEVEGMRKVKHLVFLLGSRVCSSGYSSRGHQRGVDGADSYVRA